MWAVLLLVAGAAGHRLRLARDGGYRGLVVRVAEGISEETCPTVVANIKVGSR
jgi:hypothetical protein